MAVLPLKASGPRRVLNSEWSFKVMLFKIIEDFVGIIQNIGVNMIIIIRALVQLIDILNEAEGSKTENKLVIIMFMRLILYSKVILKGF